MNMHMWNTLCHDLVDIIVSFLIPSQERKCLNMASFIDQHTYGLDMRNSLLSLIHLNWVNRLHCDMVERNRISWYGVTTWYSDVISPHDVEWVLKGFPISRLVLDYSTLFLPNHTFVSR